jgi:hypothetical protein
MRHTVLAITFASITSLLSGLGNAYADDDQERDSDRRSSTVPVGPRPYYLIDQTSPSPLKRRLQQCSAGPSSPTGRAPSATTRVAWG